MDLTLPKPAAVRNSPAADITIDIQPEGNPGGSFDRLTRLAGRVLRAPICLLSAMEGTRQRLSAAVGLPERWLSGGEPLFLELLCRPCIRSRRPVLIEDVRSDSLPDHAGDLLELEVRALIAVPLIRSDGTVLGAFCVADRRPRRWTEEQVETLSDLSAALLTELDLRLENAERREAEDALGRSEQRFRLLAENIPEVFWITDPASDRLEYASPGFERVWGRSVESVQTSREAFLDTIHPEDRERVIATAERLRDGTYQEDYRILRPDGDVRWIRDRGFAAADESGEIHRIVGIAEDITERKHRELSERLLSQTGALLASSLDPHQILQTIAQLVVPELADHCLVDLADSEGRIERMEVAFARTLDSGTAERLLRHYRSASPPESLAMRTLRTREPLLIADVTAKHLEEFAQDAAHLDLLKELGIRSMMALPLVANGQFHGALTLVTGTSGRRFTQRDLGLAEEVARLGALAVANARLYRQAQEATHAREEILAVVSHEMQSPLTALRLVLEMVLGVQPSEASAQWERKQLRIALRSAEQMTRLVRDLLDITRIEAGLLTIRQRREETAPLLAEAFAVLESLAAPHSLRVRSDIPELLPAIFVDRQRVLQVFSNLIANAVRATHAGGAITIGAEALEGAVRFFVSDTGPGIRGDEIHRLFESYWQGAAGTAGGAGLGLPIARGIVEAHGGRLWVDSVPGEGSTFSFTLALADGVQREGADDSANSLDTTAILRSLTRRGNGEGSVVPPIQLSKDSAAQRTRSLDLVKGTTGGPNGDPRSVTVHLREHILNAVHLGDLAPEDRLPSIRQVASALRVPYQSVVQAYSALEAEGVVEKRNRSGMFVAPLGVSGPQPAGETSRWIADVLTQAFQHQIKIPHLAQLIQRLTAAVPSRCVCVESTEDQLAALCNEMSQQFGIESRPCPVERLPRLDASGLLRVEEVSRDLRTADLLVTTAMHAPALRLVANALAKPLVVVTMHPEFVAAVERRLERGELTVVCADPAFGERVLGFRGGEYRDRIRVVLATDHTAVAALDRSQPVLLTRAANNHLQSADLRLIVPFSPFISPASARELVAVLIRLNLAASRA